MKVAKKHTFAKQNYTFFSFLLAPHMHALRCEAAQMQRSRHQMQEPHHIVLVDDKCNTDKITW
jgi:hypothetical protein